MALELVKIVLAGEGGQGVQSIANIMAEAAYKQGKEVLYIPNFGVEQRGGVSVAFLQVSDKKISSLKFPKADIVVALSERAILRTLQYVDENTVFIYDSSLPSAEIPKNANKVLSIPAMEIVSRDYHPRVFNVLIMGAVVELTKLVTIDAAKEALVAKLQYKFDKSPELKQMNLDVLDQGAQLVAGHA